jgi:cytochrome c-type biogenesis protein CcmE
MNPLNYISIASAFFVLKLELVHQNEGNHIETCQIDHFTLGGFVKLGCFKKDLAQTSSWIVDDKGWLIKFEFLEGLADHWDQVQTLIVGGQLYLAKNKPLNHEL